MSGEDGKSTLETSGEDGKITLETSGEQGQITTCTGKNNIATMTITAGLKANKMYAFRLSSTLVSSVFFHLLHSFRV